MVIVKKKKRKKILADTGMNACGFFFSISHKLTPTELRLLWGIKSIQMGKYIQLVKSIILSDITVTTVSVDIFCFYFKDVCWK